MHGWLPCLYQFGGQIVIRGVGEDMCTLLVNVHRGSFKDEPERLLDGFHGGVGNDAM